MSVSVRTDNLRKVYHSPPPSATGARGGSGGGSRWFRKRPTSEARPATTITALDGLSLDIRAGQIFGLLGPNGAGKSTTVGILTTRVRPTAGKAWIGAHDVWHERVTVKRLIGVVQQRPNLDFGLTAREISMLFAGIWAVAMPLLAEFQFTREIEDRLLAPMEIEWLAVEKVVAGMIQALVAGLVVVPIGWLVLGEGVNLDFSTPITFFTLALLVSCLSAAIGLTLGCSVSQQGIGLMFSLVLTPMIFFGCAYYPWSTLSGFPLLQAAVLLNPMVYASEGFRAALVPQFPHLPLAAVFAGLTIFDAGFLAVGLWLFQKKAVG